jgi:hypothetical protein
VEIAAGYDALMEAEVGNGIVPLVSNAAFTESTEHSEMIDVVPVLGIVVGANWKPFPKDITREPDSCTGVRTPFEMGTWAKKSQPAPEQGAVPLNLQDPRVPEEIV